MYIKVNGDSKEDLLRALREFSKRVKKAELMTEIRNRQYYLKPSKAKVRRQQESIKRRKREERRQERFDKRNP